MRGHVDRGRQGFGKALETPVILPGLGNGIELALGFLDLRSRRRIDRRIIRAVDDLLADDDEIAAHA